MLLFTGMLGSLGMSQGTQLVHKSKNVFCLLSPFEATDPGPKRPAPSPFGHLGADREGGESGAAGAQHTGGNITITVELHQGRCVLYIRKQQQSGYFPFCLCTSLAECC